MKILANQPNLKRRPLYYDATGKLHKSHDDIDEITNDKSNAFVVILLCICIVAVVLLILLALMLALVSPLRNWWQASTTLQVAVAILIFIASLSLGTFMVYAILCRHYNDDCKYYVGDFPFETRACWILFWCMFCAWPILFYKMWKLKRSGLEAEIQGANPLEASEEAEGADDEEGEENDTDGEEDEDGDGEDEVEAKEEDGDNIVICEEVLRYSLFNTATPPPADVAEAQSALNNFINFKAKHSYDVGKSKLTESIDEAREAVTAAEERLAYCKRVLESAQEDLKRFEENPSETTTIPTENINEFARIIAGMRGVMNIEYVEKRQFLRIVVRVLSDIDGTICDLGDFHIIIREKKLEAYYYRHGTFYNCTRYRDGSCFVDCYGAYYELDEHEFCLGNYGPLIDSYIENNQYVEAVTLAIEALHHINPGDIDDALKTYRKVKIYDGCSFGKLKKLAKAERGVAVHE